MATKYARTPGGNWSTDATWSTTSGGGADTTKPVAGDTALLDANSGSVTIDVASAADIVNCTGYTATLTQNANMTTAGSITLVSGMTFTYTSGTWTHNGVTSTITSAAKSWGAVTFLDGVSSGPTYTLADDMTVTGTLTINNSVNAFTITINGNSINAKGDVATGATNRNVNGTTNLKINGTGNQNVTMTFYSTFVLNLPFSIASTGGTVTLGGATFKIGNSWTYTSGTVSSGTSTIWFFDTVSVTSGTMTFNNIEIQNTAASKTLTLVDNLTVNGTLNLDVGTTSGVDYTMNGSTVNIKGNTTSGATNRSLLGTTTLEINGTGAQNFTYTAYTTSYLGLAVTINKSSNTLTFPSQTLKVGNTWTYTAGTVDFTTNSVTFQVNASSSINLGTVSLYDFTVSSGTATLTGNLDVNNNLQINSGTTFAPGSNTVTLAGNWTNNGTFTRATSTITFDG